MAEGKKKIIIVVPAYNESDNLRMFVSAIHEVIKGLSTYAWEILFINDGSLDNTWEIIGDLARSIPHIKGICLSRNFGKEVALTAGIDAVGDADAAIFIDADLQHPPPVIAELVAQWESGYQIVVTKRTAVPHSWVREVGSRFFYFMIKRFSDLDMLQNTTDYRLLDRKAVKALKTFEERTRFFRGLIDWMGFRKTVISFSAPERAAGQSSFSFLSLMRFAINSFTSFSLQPLRFTGWLGLFVVSVTSLLMLYMAVTQIIFTGVDYKPIAYFVVFNTLLFGIVLAALGLIGLYIGHIHTEVIRRPLYIVQDRVGFGNG